MTDKYGRPKTVLYTASQNKPFTSGFRYDSDGNVDFLEKKLMNIGSAVDLQDAVTLNQVETLYHNTKGKITTLQNELNASKIKIDTLTQSVSDLQLHKDSLETTLNNNKLNTHQEITKLHNSFQFMNYPKFVGYYSDKLIKFPTQELSTDDTLRLLANNTLNLITDNPIIFPIPESSTVDDKYVSMNVSFKFTNQSTNFDQFSHIVEYNQANKSFIFKKSCSITLRVCITEFEVDPNVLMISFDIMCGKIDDHHITLFRNEYSVAPEHPPSTISLNTIHSITHNYLPNQVLYLACFQIYNRVEMSMNKISYWMQIDINSFTPY
jgi:hypothetical protein